MTETIDIRELPARLDELIALAAAGREIILSDGSGLRARLVPLDRPATVTRVPGLHLGMVVPAADFDAPLLDDVR